MNRIASRAMALFLIAALLIGGFVFFIIEYMVKADDWVIFPGSPHVYNGGNIGCGAVTDRDGTLLLDMNGICASSGSACTSGSLDPSHVLLAIGLKHEVAHGSLRVTFGESNTIEDADRIVDELKTIVARLREMSPLYEAVKNR